MFIHTSLTEWLATLGSIGLLCIIFAETGLFFGFFLPGDSLLFAAGFLASQKIFNIWFLIPSMIVTAILGYQVGYYFGRYLGNWLLKRKETFWFKRKYLQQADAFYQRHGGKALILGRLVPVVRTFIPVVAGMTGMKLRRYVMYNFYGAIVWVGSLTLLGYYLGQIVPNADQYILPVVLVIIVLSLLPALWQLLRNYFRRS